MIHIDICPACEELGDDKPKLLCDNCGFCIEEHCDEYCEIASLLRHTVRHEPRGRGLTNSTPVTGEVVVNLVKLMWR